MLIPDADGIKGKTIFLDINKQTTFHVLKQTTFHILKQTTFHILSEQKRLHWLAQEYRRRDYEIIAKMTCPMLSKVW